MGGISLTKPLVIVGVNHIVPGKVSENFGSVIDCRSLFYWRSVSVSLMVMAMAMAIVIVLVGIFQWKQGGDGEFDRPERTAVDPS